MRRQRARTNIFENKKVIIGAIAGITVLILLIGGIIMVNSSGNNNKTKGAKKDVINKKEQKDKTEPDETDVSDKDSDDDVPDDNKEDKKEPNIITKTIKDVRIEVKNLSSDLIVHPVDEHSTIFQVTIKGEESIINSITKSDIEATINLSGYTKPGPFNVTVSIKCKKSNVEIVTKKTIEIVIVEKEVHVPPTEEEEIDQE